MARYGNTGITVKAAFVRVKVAPQINVTNSKTVFAMSLDDFNRLAPFDTPHA